MSVASSTSSLLSETDEILDKLESTSYIDTGSRRSLYRVSLVNSIIRSRKNSDANNGINEVDYIEPPAKEFFRSRRQTSAGRTHISTELPVFMTELLVLESAAKRSLKSIVKKIINTLPSPVEKGWEYDITVSKKRLPFNPTREQFFTV